MQKQLNYKWRLTHQKLSNFRLEENDEKIREKCNYIFCCLLMKINYIKIMFTRYEMCVKALLKS